MKRIDRRKLLGIEEIRDRCEGEKVVMCHGVWDLLHPGHISHLEQSAQFGSVLVVGVTCDKHVALAKGDGHPKFHQYVRALNLAALSIVDYVVIDHCATPVENLRILQPALYSKGPDYALTGPARTALLECEGKVLEEYGGSLVITTGEKLSSTSLQRSLDVGPYHRDPVGYKELVESVYSAVPNTQLPPEFARCISDNLLMLTIRLARYKFVSKMLKQTDRVLEIGAGYGIGAVFMGQFCQKVVGVDVQLDCVLEAARFCPRDNVEFRELDFLVHEGPLGSYDTVVAMDVIEHWTLEQGKQAIERMSLVVADNGMVVLGCPSVYSQPYQCELSYLSHVHCYDRDELLEILERYFGRVLCFSMNDEVVHTGHPKMAWYYYFLCFYPKERG